MQRMDLMRRFSIRTRMLGAIVVVLVLLALVGASVEKVDSGSRLVHDAGTTMNEIVASLKRVSDTIAEISVAAMEQNSGIGQVNAAAAQLDQMTQQNAARVEQSTAAAENLKAQAQQLAQMIGVFRLGAAGVPASA